MADQGRWFKLWASAISDPDLRSLSLEDFGRWCAFGVYLKVHGKDGFLSMRAPALPLQELLRLSTFDAVVLMLRSFPHCVTATVTDTPVTLTVTWQNWQRYQGDYSGNRTKAWRSKKTQYVTANVTAMRRSGDATETPKEEKRREGLKDLKPTSLRDGNLGHAAARERGLAMAADFERFWEAYPLKKGKKPAKAAWWRHKPPIEQVLEAIATAKLSRDWTKDNGEFIPHPTTWLNQERWTDEVETVSDPYVNFPRV